MQARRVSIKFVIVGVLFILVGGLGSGLILAQNPEGGSPDVMLFVSPDALTLHISSYEPVDLEGFQFSVYRNGDIFSLSLEVRFGLLVLSDYIAQPGACYVMLYGNGSDLPAECSNESLIFISTVDSPGDRFWYEGDRRLDIMIQDNSHSTSEFCPTRLDRCPIFWRAERPILPTPTPTQVPITLAVLPDPKPVIAGITLDGGAHGQVLALQWIPGTNHILSGHQTGTICVWVTNRSAQTDPLLCEEDAHLYGVRSFAWNPSGEGGVFATVGGDALVRLWEVSIQADGDATLAHLEDLEGHTAGLRDVIWHPHHPRLLTIGDDERMILWDTEANDVLINEFSHSPRAVSYRADGRYIAVIDNRGVVTVVDSDKEHANVNIGMFSTSGLDVTWNQNKNAIATIDADGNLNLYDNYRVGTICHDSNCPHIELIKNLNDPGQIAFSPNGSMIAATSRGSMHIMEAQAPYRQVNWYVPVVQEDNPLFTAVAWSLRNDVMAAGDEQGAIHIWDVQSEIPDRLPKIAGWNIKDVIGSSSPVNAFEWSVDGYQIAVVDRSRRLSIWQVQSQQEIGEKPAHTKIPLALDWHPQQKLIATGGCGPMGIVWNQVAEEEVFLEDESDATNCVRGIAFQPPHGNILALANESWVKIMRWKDHEELTARAFNALINDIDWDSSGQYLASIDENGVLQVFQSMDENSQLTEVLVRQPEAGISLNSLAWAPDGTELATASANGWIAIWSLDGDVSAPGFQNARHLHGHTESVTAVSWDASGHYLASIDESGHLIVWDASLGQRLVDKVLEENPVDIQWSPVHPVLAIVDRNSNLSIWGLEL